MKKTFLKSILLSTLTLVSLFNCGDGFKFIISGLDKPSNTELTNSANTSKQDDKNSNSNDQSNIDDKTNSPYFQ